jgi:hypothetical protein
MPAHGADVVRYSFIAVDSHHLLLAGLLAHLCKNASLELILAIRFSRDLQEDRMRRFVEGADRDQGTLFPECLEDWIDEDNPVRVIDVFVDEIDLGALGFGGVDPEATGRPSYHPSVLLKFTSTAISIGFNLAGGLSMRLGATSR